MTDTIGWGNMPEVQGGKKEKDVSLWVVLGEFTHKWRKVLKMVRRNYKRGVNDKGACPKRGNHKQRPLEIGQKKGKIRGRKRNLESWRPEKGELFQNGEQSFEGVKHRAPHLSEKGGTKHVQAEGKKTAAV